MARLPQLFVPAPPNVHTVEPIEPYDLRWHVPDGPARWDVRDLSNMLPGETLSRFRDRGEQAAAYWANEDANRVVKKAPQRGEPGTKPRGRPTEFPLERGPNESDEDYMRRRRREAAARARRRHGVPSRAGVVEGTQGITLTPQKLQALLVSAWTAGGNGGEMDLSALMQEALVAAQT